MANPEKCHIYRTITWGRGLAQRIHPPQPPLRSALSGFLASKSWMLRMLRINPKKTKIVIFQRCTKKCDYVFHIAVK